MPLSLSLYIYIYKYTHCGCPFNKVKITAETDGQTLGFAQDLQGNPPTELVIGVQMLCTKADSDDKAISKCQNSLGKS